MKSLSLTYILLSIFVLSAQGVPITVPRIFDFRNGTYDINEKTLIEGYKDCGSAGKILLVGFGQCKKTPCDLKVGVEYGWILDFLVAGYHDKFAVRVDVRSGDEVMNVSHIELPIPLDPGRHALIFDTVVQAQHKGFNYIQLRVVASDIDEVCMLAEVIIQ